MPYFFDFREYMLENFLQNMAELCYFILYCVKIHALHFFLKERCVMEKYECYTSITRCYINIVH